MKTKKILKLLTCASLLGLAFNFISCAPTADNGIEPDPYPIVNPTTYPVKFEGKGSLKINENATPVILTVNFTDTYEFTCSVNAIGLQNGTEIAYAKGNYSKLQDDFTFGVLFFTNIKVHKYGENGEFPISGILESMIDNSKFSLPQEIIDALELTLADSLSLKK